MHQDEQTVIHVPVLLEATLQYLDPQEGESYLDLTAGYGGHAQSVMKRIGHAPTVLVDRDIEAISALKDKFSATDAQIIHSDFLSASRELAAEGRTFDLILADLGVSSPHLNEATRGFAITTPGPLDMRMDQSQQLTAARIVNHFSLAELITILSEYGEEPKARRIAQLIVEHRPFADTTELAHVVARAWPGHSRVHPATRTFQAIRIAVNDELGLLERSLPIWIDMLNPGGRIAIISFHSLEDRLVKRALAEAAGEGYDARLRILTKHPYTASDTELVFNPRARSAKLRAAAKIKIK